MRRALALLLLMGITTLMAFEPLAYPDGCTIEARPILRPAPQSDPPPRNG